MQADARKLAHTLSERIELNNSDEMIWKANNELDYFKTQTLKLFKDNKQLRLQQQLLKKKVKDLQEEIEISDMTMQKLQKKYMKQLIANEKLMSGEARKNVKVSVGEKGSHL